MSDPRLLIFGGIGLAIGLFIFYRGIMWHRQKKLVEITPTSKVRSIAMGYVEVYGEALPAEGKILKSPFTDVDCVYCRYTIEEYRSSGKSGSWHTIKHDEKRDLFYLKDDTGQVLIDPAGADIDIPIDNEFKSSMGKDPPEKVMGYLKRNNISFEGFLGINKQMRYREYFIAVGDKLYIMGNADDNPYRTGAVKSSDDIIIKKAAKGEMFYISDKQEKDVLKSMMWKSIGLMLLGGLATLVCLGLLLHYFGMM